MHLLTRFYYVEAIHSEQLSSIGRMGFLILAGDPTPCRPVSAVRFRKGDGSDRRHHGTF